MIEYFYINMHTRYSENKRLTFRVGQLKLNTFCINRNIKSEYILILTFNAIFASDASIILYNIYKQ